ncbi:hypothetical protein WSK_0294 [Novosphingobium sp. Rr 2-17]|uniref:hypothetical protein n=1 Tax=Novosphingobium sp. Rr 2-17 TaxID=555793 RepID=UPI0002698B4A|nr:hypothetical protein [Novosphingobium sp. Rr 2-17]EIZ81142.1 hypothetical protein WSK_0294 [Novosphingobium sp. Rr 2-17]
MASAVRALFAWFLAGGFIHRWIVMRMAYQMGSRLRGNDEEGGAVNSSNRPSGYSPIFVIPAQAGTQLMD